LAFFVFPILQMLGAFGLLLTQLYGFLMVGALVLCFIPSRIVVGGDGIEHRWLWWRRFFPLRDVRALKRTFLLPARLVLKNGKQVFLPFTFSARNDIMGTRSAALVAIDRAIAWAADQPAPNAAIADHLLPRTGEEAAAWRARLTADRGGYRVEPVSNDVLWRIVDEPALDAPTRAGAAVLLASGADADARARMGEIAGTTANTKLRVLLKRAAKGAPEEEVASRFEDIAAQARTRR
jgi:hypothetical protein